MKKLKLFLAAMAAMVTMGMNAQQTLDITDLYITNPGFELGNTNGWTVGASSDTGARSTTNDTYKMSNSEGDWLFNTWWQGIPITQTIQSLPAGSYTLASVVASDGATVYMISGDDSNEYVYTETTDSKIGIQLTKNFTLTEATDYKIGAVGGANGTAGEHKDYIAEGYWWYKVDNFRLVLNLENGATIPSTIVEKLLANVPSGTMSTSVQTALNNAVSAFQNDATMENYTAALEAMATARTSIASYSTIASGTVPTNNVAGWAISTIKGELACNTWSEEGNSDGSNMTTPFIQDWASSGNALGAGKLYYRLEGLNPGEKYSVSALVRVLDESGAAVSGATFFVNSVTKDIATAGSPCTKGIAGTMNAAAEVDDNGVLEFGIESSSNSTFNWMSIKDVTISEYAGAMVTNIELSQSSASLTTGDALHITATVTPDNADDKTVTWSSDNEAVATVTAAGIVQAVSPGTATITATANDGSGVSASCAVTVANAAAPANYSEIAEGKFLILNAATGKYLGQGNNYGTHASIVEHGVLATVTADGSNFKITGICNNSGFGSNAYVDNGTPAAFTATKQANGTYTLTLDGKLVAAQAGTTLVNIDGTDANNALAQWYFISEETAKKNLAAATSTNPVDVTYYILDPNFSRNADHSVWTMDASNKNLSGGHDVNQCAESYHSTFTLSQELTVPNGTYKLRAQATANSDATGAVVYANDEETAFKVMSHGENSMTNCSDRFTEGEYYTEWITIDVTDHTLTVGVKGGNGSSWCVWDNFELYMTNYIPVTAINASIDDDEIEVGATATITASTTPSPASFDNLIYISSDESIATVDEDGVVTGVAAGSATITVKAEVEDFSTPITVTVTAPAIVPTGITLNETEIALNETTTTATLIATVAPEGASQAVIFASSDETVATVSDEGLITAVLPGTTTITVTSAANASVSTTATVTVTFPETVVPESYYVNDGATRTVYTLGENLIKNGSFEYPNAYYGWTYGTGSTTPITSEKFDIVTEGAADGSQYLKAKTNEGGGSAGSLNTSWELEDGKTYVFGYKIKANTGATANQYIGTSLNNTKGQENANKKFDAPTYGTDWTEVKYKFTNDENFKYLVFNARWLSDYKSFDGFYLVEVVSEDVVGNVDYATAAIPTANIGSGAFQYSQDAVDAANALVQGTATVAEVEAAYEALTTLNVPEATQAYNLVFICEGHSATGNALTLIPNPAQTQGLYGLKYLVPANVNLAQAFYFTHTTGNKYKVHAIDTDLNERYITTQAEGYGTTWYEGIRTITDASKAMEIEIRPNGEGLYILWNTGANKAIAHNGNTNNDLFTNNSADFQIVETQKPSIALNTTAAGWGTTMLPFAVASLPEGVKAYTCAAVDGSTLTLAEVSALEANKPYIIEGAWEATLTGDAQGTALNYTEGLLTGVYETIAAPNGSYILQKQDDKVGFFLVDTDTAQPNVPANRAYMTVPEGSGIKAFYLGDDEDAIKGVFDGLVNGEIYDLAGRKVQRMQKGGAYIVNGKKVLVK